MKVYIIHESKIDDNHNRIVEVWSNFDKAWSRHVELNNVTGNEYAYSIEAQEVKE